MASVAFLGLGVMGYPMAGHLKNKGGHDVTVYNRTTAKAEKWAAEHGGAFATTPSEAAEGKDFVFTCVGNDDDLRSVTIGPHGCFQAMKQGRDLHRQHHRFGRSRARTGRARPRRAASQRSTRRSPAARRAPRTAR